MPSRLLEVVTGDREAVVDLTDRCRGFLRDVEAADGLLHVFVPHATAGIAVLETGAGSDDDLLAALAELLPVAGPRGQGWRHRHGSPGHGRDHVLPAVLAPFAVLPVVEGQLLLGTWQSVTLVDTNVDNPRRTVRLSFLAGP
jgi:secondary thiamine-phosphate synthase enzyme